VPVTFTLADGSEKQVGLLTAVSPCPLATNVAAISFIGRKVSRPSAVLATGLLYALGRSLVYVALAVLLVSSLLSAPEVAHALGRWVNRLLGPLLVLIGMVLLGLVRWTGKGSSLGARVGARVEGWGAPAGFALGVVFALSFCPVSAALYFGTLIPLAVKSDSRVLVPLVYGAGTAIPVILFATVLAFGANAVGRAFERISRVERRARAATGAIFITAGIYLTLAYVYRCI